MPKKSNTPVEAISKENVLKVHSVLSQHKNSVYADVWAIGCQLGLRISDLLSIRYSDLDLDKRVLTLVESKTQKTKTITLNVKAIDTIKARQADYLDHTFLFEVDSNKCLKMSELKAISRSSVARVFKKAGDGLGLHIGTHSMRKSRGKAMFDAGNSVALIAKVLNHSSEAVTLNYIGITQKNVADTYDEIIL